MRSFTIRENDAGQRMDKFITKAVPLLPKNLMYKYLRLKRIKLNGKRCEISTRLTAGDVVEMYIGDEFFDTAPEESFRFAGPMVPIVYEDEHLLVNKPAGLVVHEDESQTQILIGRILRYLAEKGEYDPATEQSFTPSLCNRIDRNTSGLVICAKTAAALRVMNEKIKLRQIDKRYRCLVHGTPKPAEGRIEPFMRKRSDENRIEVFHHPVPQDGRTMITEYKVLGQQWALFAAGGAPHHRTHPSDPAPPWRRSAPPAGGRGQVLLHEERSGLPVPGAFVPGRSPSGLKGTAPRWAT